MRPRHDTTYVGQGGTLLVTNLDGVPRERAHGFWVDETRMLSRYEWQLDGEPPQPAGSEVVEHDRWIGYFIQHPSNWRDTPTRESDPAQQTVELLLDRRVTDAFRERVQLTNHTQISTRVRLSLAVDADFADLREASGPRRQHGEITRDFRQTGAGRAMLSLRYRAEHAYDHPEERGVARIDRSIALELTCPGSTPEHRDGRLSFEVSLGPHAIWEGSLTWSPSYESLLVLDRPAPEPASSAPRTPRPGGETLPGGATRIEADGVGDSLAFTVATAVRQAERDLAALRMLHREGRSELATFVGGWPTYTAFFGRDALAASWQSAMVSTELMRSALGALASSQATGTNTWRDEQPGRMLHEHHTGPLSALKYEPHGRYYGDVTSSIYYPTVLSGLWHWTGDLDLVRPFVKPALDALAWADRFADADGDGFYEYRSLSSQGEKNQGWKDSDDAIVYPDGSQVETPLGTCEMQGIVYASKLGMSELLLWLGDVARAREMYAQAVDLKRRFNDVFWMGDERYVAIALDSRKSLVRTIASDPGHCIAAGILDEERVPAVAARLMSPELFSGWGVRTLSARHPAYNPFAYHRGTVWPVENAVFAMGFARYGLHPEMHTLCKAQFEAARLFDLCRPPETFGGHPRDEAHPVPGLYPRADWPQAWSASAVFAMLQAMLGIVAYAPLGALLLDPHLPEWLPRITVTDLRVGAAAVDLRFERRPDGRTDYEVLDRRGKLHVVRQPSPQSLCAGWGERIRDAITSLLPGK